MRVIQDFLGLWRAHRVVHAATDKGRGAAPRPSRWLHPARSHDPVEWTSQGQGAAAGARHEAAGVIRDAGEYGFRNQLSVRASIGVGENGA
jgi:hypothetical protein